jgi:hypothetical protein
MDEKANERKDQAREEGEEEGERSGDGRKRKGGNRLSYLLSCPT